MKSFIKPHIDHADKIYDQAYRNQKLGPGVPATLLKKRPWPFLRKSFFYRTPPVAASEKNQTNKYIASALK